MFKKSYIAQNCKPCVTGGISLSNIRSGPYLFGHRDNFIILAVDQNIFKLQLYNEYGLEVHTLN